MGSQTFNLNHDGFMLRARHWPGNSEADKAIGIIHGLGEHSGRYDEVANWFVEHGYDVYAFDHQGHGESQGARGTIVSYESLITEIHTFIQAIQGAQNDVRPLFLWGHSMGALCLLSFLKTKPETSHFIAGAIATAPPLKLSAPPNVLLRSVASLAAQVAPDVTKSNDLEQAALSRDTDVVVAYQADSLVHDRISMRLGAAMLHEPKMLLGEAFDSPVPLLLMHGTADRITHPSGTRKFAGLVQGTSHLKLWEGFYHELHNEPEKQEVWKYIDNWIANL